MSENHDSSGSSSDQKKGIIKKKYTSIFHKEQPPNVLEIDQKYHSLTSEWRRVVSFKDRFYLDLEHPKTKDELWDAFLKTLMNLYHLQDGIPEKGETFEMEVVSNEKKDEKKIVEFKVEVKNKDIGMIRIFNQLDKQFFWVTYHVIYKPLIFKNQPYFWYKVLGKYEDSLDIANPRGNYIRYMFRKNARSRGEKFLSEYTKILQNTNITKHGNTEK